MNLTLSVRVTVRGTVSVTLSATMSVRVAVAEDDCLVIGDYSNSMLVEQTDGRTDGLYTVIFNLTGESTLSFIYCINLDATSKSTAISLIITFIRVYV